MFAVGDKLFIRTVTFHLVGQVKAREGDWLMLTDASWVADSGRFHEAIETGSLSEVEHVGTAYVNLATATDAFPWAHELPTTSK
jgi:hypothetical protein